MKALKALLTTCAVALACSATAQDAEIVLKEEALNTLVTRLGHPSKSGVYQPTLLTKLPGVFGGCEFFGFLDCSRTRGVLGAEFSRVPMLRCRTQGRGWQLVPAGPPVAWQWWITESRFKAVDGELSFTAKLRARVGTRWTSVEKTVPAEVALDATANVLRVRVGDFKVPVEYDFNGTPQRVEDVDVGGLSSFAIRVPPQTASVPLPNGTTRSITGRATAATASYEPGRVRVRIDLGFGGASAAAGAAWTTGNPASEDGRIGISESALNEMAAAIGTLTFQGSVSVSVPVPNPFFPIGPPVFWVDTPCDARADVSGISFDIDPTRIRVTGQVGGSICGVSLPVGGTVSTTGNVTFDASARTLRLTAGASSVRPSVTFAGRSVSAPFTVNVGPSLTLPAIPLGATAFDVVTRQGPIPLVLAGRNVQVAKRDGFIEVRGDATLR